MFFYMSGTPRNDVLQRQENSLCSHRLFSLHGDYQRAVHKWLDDVLEDPSHPYPRSIMLDSGAFTAWNAGGEVTVDEVFDSYSRFEEKCGDLFDEIWMVNLDKIPGKRGEDPTVQEINDALRISDINYKKLVDRFGERILPVYHQGEDTGRLLELASMAKYICVSPRNDMPELKRAKWAGEKHKALDKHAPGTMTHGLATTGNNMLRDVKWTSVDSAAWILHAGFGKVDIFEGDRYRNYFVSDDPRKAGLMNQHWGAQISNNPETGAVEVAVPEAVERGGKLIGPGMPTSQRLRIRERIEKYGFNTEEIVTNSRARSIVCMGELADYCRWATEYQKRKTRQDGLGLD